MIIAFITPKGGTGRTTLALNIGHALVEQGHKVLVLDADPQASALTWSDFRRRDPLFPVIGLARPTIHEELPGLARDFDTVLIDDGRTAPKITRSALIASDLIVIPVCPSPFDFWTSDHIVKTLINAWQIRPEIKACFVVNMAKANTTIVHALVEGLKEYHQVPIAQTQVSALVAFPQSQIDGSTVIEHNKNPKAVAQIRSLAKELVNMLGGNHDRTHYRC